jgi:putative spermidine/putrescine transport system ATP-binding protein
MFPGGGTTIDVPSSHPSSAGDAPDAPAVRLVEVRKTYGEVVAVERLSLEVLTGEFFTMLGPSGSGKTTTLRVIAGFELADSGRIELHGADVTRSPPYERPVNTVFQDYALFPHMTVIENVAYGLRVKGMAKRERSERAAEALQMVRLPGVESRRPIQLSGGQRQRVALARAIVNRPRVLLLDEPLGALDLKLRQEMQLELKAIQRELSERITFIYVTHDQDEALTMSDRIAVFSDGRIEQVGTPGEIYERPANEFVAGFVGTSNVIERDGRRYMVRPEKIRMLSGAEEDATAVPGVVREVAYLGSVTRYVVEAEGGETLVVLRQNLDMSAARALDRLCRARQVRGLLRRNGHVDETGRGQPVRHGLRVRRCEPAPDPRWRPPADERQPGAGMEELHPSAPVSAAQHGRRKALRDLPAVGAKHPALQPQVDTAGADELVGDLQPEVQRPGDRAEQPDPDRRCGAVPVQDRAEPGDQRPLRADRSAAERGGEAAQRTTSADQEVLGAGL